MKRLSIIIVTYNSEKDIFDCIRSIVKYNDLPDNELEIIVVDNNSKETDTMFNMISKEFGNQIVLIRNTKNGGYGQGNNVGIKQCHAPIVMIMNPDVRLYEPVFKTVIEYLENNKNVSIYGMKQMLTPTEKSSNSFTCTYRMNGYFGTLLTALCTRLDIFLSSIMHFSGSCFFIRKNMFEEVGLFDESIFMYGEEDDIHYRIGKRFGYDMHYNPRLHYLHLTKDKQPNFSFEKKLIDASLDQCDKHGYSKKETLRSRIQTYRLLLIRIKIQQLFGRGNPALRDILRQSCRYIKQLQSDL